MVSPRWLLVTVLALAGCARVGFEPAVLGADSGDAAVVDGVVDGWPAEGGEGAAPPQIVALTAPRCLAGKLAATVSVEAVDPAGGALSCAWSAEQGAIAGAGREAQFTPGPASGQVCPQVIAVTVTSERTGLAATRTAQLFVTAIGDVDGDGVVTEEDVGVISAQWDRTDCCPGGAATLCSGDLDRDCAVDITDLGALAGHFGERGCACPGGPLTYWLCNADRWCWLHPEPVGQAIHGIWASGPDNAVAVGDSGLVLRFDGTGWRGERTLSSQTLRAVWGAGPTRVVAVGDHFAALEYDGTGWDDLQLSPAAPQRLADVFGCGDRWFAVGSAGALLEWVAGVPTIEYLSGSQELVGVWCHDADTLYVAAADGEVLERDGGAWSQLRGAGNRLKAIWGESPSQLTVVGALAPTILTGLVDRYDGSGWGPSEVPGVLLEGVWGVGSTLYVAGGTSEFPVESVAIRFDGTAQTVLGGAVRAGLADVWGSSADHVLFAGALGAVLRYDGSAVHGTSPLVAAPLRAVWGTSATSLVVGGGGEVLHRAGASWSREACGLTAVRGLWGSGPSAVFAVGQGGVARYDGSSWSQVHASSGLLQAVWGESGSTGIALLLAVGDGVAAHSGDGALWMEIGIGGDELRAIWGASATEAYAVGTVVMRYDGSAWSPLEQQPSLDVPLSAVAGLDGVLYAVDTHGDLFYRAANGSAWHTFQITDGALHGLAAARGTLFAVGEEGAAFRRVADTAWYRMSTAGRDLFSVVNAGEDVVAVGAAGTVLEYRGP